MENEQILLRDGEELLWQGRPPTGIIFRAYDLFFVPFSILWTSFAIFWTLIVYLELAPQVFASGTIAPEAIPFLIIGPVFVAIGLSFTIGRFFFDSHRRAKTRYAVTSKRAIIQKGSRGAEIDSMPITAGLRIKVKGRNVGDIMLGEERGIPALLMWQTPIWGPSHPFTFERINDVRAVYDLILKVQDRNSN